MDIWDTPHVSDIERQIRWELQGIERGVQRVREQMDEQKVGDSPIGLRLIGDIAPRLVEKIAVAQKEAQTALTSGARGRTSPWWWLIVLLEADQLAVIVLKSILANKPREFTFNLAVTAAAAAIDRNIHTQLDFEMWKEAENKKPDKENQYLHFMRRVPSMDVRRFKKFSEKIERVRLERWDHKDGIILGAKLIQLLVEAAPEWFSLATNRLRGGRRETQIVFSDMARETMADFAEQSELSRPMLLPMIVPPADWRTAA